MIIYTFCLQGNDPSCLREFLLPILCRDSPSGNPGLQVNVHLLSKFLVRKAVLLKRACLYIFMI